MLLRRGVGGIYNDGGWRGLNGLLVNDWGNERAVGENMRVVGLWEKSTEI